MPPEAGYLELAFFRYRVDDLTTNGNRKNNIGIHIIVFKSGFNNFDDSAVNIINNIINNNGNNNNNNASNNVSINSNLKNSWPPAPKLRRPAKKKHTAREAFPV